MSSANLAPYSISVKEAFIAKTSALSVLKGFSKAKERDLVRSGFPMKKVSMMIIKETFINTYFMMYSFLLF
jgi:hypothetical protein